MADPADPSTLDILARAERALDQARSDSAKTEATAAAARDALARLQAQRDDLARTLSERDETLASTMAAHAQTREQLAALTAEHQAAVSRLEALEAKLDDARERVEVAAALEHKRAEKQRLAERALEEARGAGELTHGELERERAARLAAEAREIDLAATRARLEEQLAQAQARLEAAGGATAAALEAAEHALDAAKAERTGDSARAAADLSRLRGEVETLERQFTEACEQLEAERAAHRAAREALAALRSQVEGEHTRAEAAQAVAEQAVRRAKELEQRVVVRLQQEDDAPLDLARSGKVGLAELAQLMLRLSWSRADVRVELGVNRGTRRLWLRGGALVAGQSSVRFEALSDRARRDGLIDARQDADLRDLHEGSPTHLLEEMRQRGLVRKSELPGLVQRYAEEVALEALSEPESTYRLQLEPPEPDVPTAEGTRPLPQLVAAALRRAFSFESHLELLGGTQALPRRRGALELEKFGFSDSERRLLESCDGNSTVDVVQAASPLKPERAWQVLSVAKLLGMLELSPPRVPAPTKATLAELLEAKYQQAQQADYFTILGLSRTAGAEEVKRAHLRLLHQFEPLQHGSDADPSIRHRARVVLELVDEAARTLKDDRLRLEYARHLLD